MATDPQRARRLTLPLIVRLLLGAVFLTAAVDKIIHPADFARAIYNYQILPDILINLAALVLPWLELLLGLCLVAGFWLPGAALWSIGLLAVFYAALLFNVYRGIDIHCGCFSTRPDPSSLPPTTWYMVRDGFFLLLGLTLLHQVFRPGRSRATPFE
jgi:uncharacterized membrane protein YphA (DoxX/SURF4 family)